MNANTATNSYPNPTISVFTSCTCDPHPKRWFMCRCDSVLVAEYECHGKPDSGEMVSSQDIAHVAALHPGMALVY